MPDDRGTPIVADPDGSLGADVIEQPDDVGGQLPNVVGIDRLQARRPAATALIGCQHVIASPREHRDLVAPRVGQLGKPVRQDDHLRSALAGLDDPQPHPIGIY